MQAQRFHPGVRQGLLDPVEAGGVAGGDQHPAGRLVAVAGSVLPGPATQGFALGVGDGRGFVQTSDVRGQTMFCVIAFFTSGARAFIVTRCTPYPQDTTTVTRLARDQLTRAR